MGRKTIAVCVTGYDWEYESRIVNGIFMRCRELDINLLVFSNLKRKPELNSDRVLPESVIWGEMEIFKLINYDTVDGIIIIGESILDENVIGQIYEQAKLHGIPAVNVNDSKHVLSGNVLLSDKRAMEFVMSHLVEDHGFTKINFIGGFPGNLQTEERLAAYKKILSEHNIPIEEDRIAYGEFWKRSIDCTNKFLDAPELPQAIVCASDTMAIFCMDTIKERGLRIPEDIVVTGFDGIKDCELYSPTITSVRRGFNEAGIAAVDVLADLWSGRSNAPVTVNVDSVLVRNGSCGCASPAKSKNFFNSFYDDQNNLLELSTDINEMNSKFANAATSAELFAET
jgi:DNA-binding LacI/PurR family transcriptional regulator